MTELSEKAQQIISSYLDRVGPHGGNFSHYVEFDANKESDSAAAFSHPDLGCPYICAQHHVVGSIWHASFQQEAVGALNCVSALQTVGRHTRTHPSSIDHESHTVIPERLQASTQQCALQPGLCPGAGRS